MISQNLQIRYQEEINRLKLQDLKQEYQEWCDILIAARGLKKAFGERSLEASTVYADIELVVELKAHQLEEVEKQNQHPHLFYERRGEYVFSKNSEG